MTAPLLEIQGLVKHFGALTATDRLNLAIQDGEIHAIIGPNGAGKTTLINQISGELRPDGGRILFAGTPVHRMPVHKRAAMGMARTYQITRIFPGLSVMENVKLAVQARTGHSFRFFRNADQSGDEQDQALDVLTRIELDHRAAEPAGRLSHGEQRQLEIAMALATRPRLFLLDEPMAGMGVRASKRMTALLKQIGQDHTLLLVEHDMQAVFALADRISVMVYGRIIAAGAPAEIRENPEVKQAYLGEERNDG